MSEPSFDRYLAACEDRYAERCRREDDDPEMAGDADDYYARVHRADADAEARWENARDMELENRGE